MTKLRVGICACESSGDELGASLIKSMLLINPDIEFVGIAGPKMISMGCDAIAHTSQLSVMGFAEVIGRLPSIWLLQRKIISVFLTNPPDVFIGIDGPDFNFPIEKNLKKTGVPVVHYVSPSVWAWRKYRLNKISDCVDLMLTLFPFERAVYEEQDIRVKYTGHPLLKNNNNISNTAAITQLGLDLSQRWVALLPGSRKGEVSRLLPLFLDVARKCIENEPVLKFIMPVANTLDFQWIEQTVREAGMADTITLVPGEQAQLAMSVSEVALVASGTATFECMLAGTPMVVAYKLHPLSYQIVKRMINVDYVSLPNHLGSKEVVPEFIQSTATVNNISSAMQLLLDDQTSANQQRVSFKQIISDMESVSSMTTVSDAIFDLLASGRKNHVIN